jgi:hypothetical protein
VDERVVRTDAGAVGVYARLGHNVGLEGLQQVGEGLAAHHAAEGAREVWVWMWGWDMDTEGPAACVSYARPGLIPVTEWTNPAQVAGWYLAREARQRGLTAN